MEGETEVSAPAGEGCETPAWHGRGPHRLIRMAGDVLSKGRGRIW